MIPNNTYYIILAPIVAPLCTGYFETWQDGDEIGPLPWSEWFGHI